MNVTMNKQVKINYLRRKNAIERFFDNDITIIVLLLAYIGLAEVNLIVALLVGLVALLAGVMKCITLWQQMKNNRLDQEIKQKELDKLNGLT